ncbi:MAG: flagellar biosynthesis protein FlhF [bacterium]
MQIKKYNAPTLKEAINSMKNELGDEAVILSTRVIEGDSRAGRHKSFEVTCGIEDDYDSAPAVKPQKEVKKKEGAKSFETELKKLTEKVYGVSSNEAFSEKVKSKTNIENETIPAKNELREIAEILNQRDIDKSIINSIIEQLNRYSAFLTPDNIDNYVVSTISSMLSTSKFEINKSQKPKIISLIGPTGVGKTTCIAKLAVISKILHKLDVGLISIDTYRLGALDQLRIFSEVSNIDLLIAYEPSEMPKLLSKFKKKDLVFIDTVGRSQKNTALLKGIKDFIDAVKTDDVYLVLNTTSSTKTLLDVANKFKFLNFNGLIFSKLDEAVTYGNILNVANAFNVPIKYLTNGQVIPDDIIAAEPEFIANMIYTGKIN